MNELKTSVKKCLICKSGFVVQRKRDVEKEGFVIYGRNGTRNAYHVESRCNFRNSNFECGSGYFYGYMTYKGTKIMDDNALKNDVLVTSSQTGFDIDYLVELINRGLIGIARVHGILIEYLATVTDKKQLDFVIYDDACHLVKYSRNEKVAERNETTKFVSERKFVIDKGSCQNSSTGIFWNGPPFLLGGGGVWGVGR